MLEAAFSAADGARPIGFIGLSMRAKCVRRKHYVLTGISWTKISHAIAARVFSLLRDRAKEELKRFRRAQLAERNAIGADDRHTAWKLLTDSQRRYGQEKQPALASWKTLGEFLSDEAFTNQRY